MPTYACNLPTYVRHILPSRLIAVSLSSSLVVSLRPAGRTTCTRAIHVPLCSPPVSAGSERAARNRCLQLSLRNILLKGALRAIRKRAGATIFRSRDLGCLTYTCRYASNIIGIHCADFWENRRIAPRRSSEEMRPAIYSLRELCYFRMVRYKTSIMEASREAIAFITKGSRCQGCFERFSFYVFIIIEWKLLSHL